MKARPLVEQQLLRLLCYWEGIHLSPQIPVCDSALLCDSHLLETDSTII